MTAFCILYSAAAARAEKKTKRVYLPAVCLFAFLAACLCAAIFIGLARLLALPFAQGAQAQATALPSFAAYAGGALLFCVIDTDETTMPTTVMRMSSRQSRLSPILISPAPMVMS